MAPDFRPVTPAFANADAAFANRALTEGERGGRVAG